MITNLLLFIQVAEVNPYMAINKNKCTSMKKMPDIHPSVGSDLPTRPKWNLSPIGDTEGSIFQTLPTLSI